MGITKENWGEKWWSETCCHGVKKQRSNRQERSALILRTLRDYSVEIYEADK